MDYYSILGVPRNVSDKDLKKAYKQKSMQHHPDRGGNEEEFKKINEAYSTLKDPQKRAEYDNPQVRMNSQNFNGSFNDAFGNNFADVFNSMFGGGFQNRPHQHSRANADVRLKVHVDFVELWKGKKVIATYRLRNGQEKSVDLDIPIGVRDGDTIRFQGLGDNSIPNMRPGDLFVIIKVDNNTQWRREGDNVHGFLNIDCLDMIVGTKHNFQTPDGRSIELNIKQGTKNNTTLSLRGYGVPNVHNHQPGNLYVTIQAIIPTNLDNDSLRKIREVIDAKTR